MTGTATAPQRPLARRGVPHARIRRTPAPAAASRSKTPDQNPFTKTNRNSPEPLDLPLITLVISGHIYSSVVRHGSDGIDQHAFHPLVRVQIAGSRYPGWIHIPEHATPNQVTEMASYRRPA